MRIKSQVSEMLIVVVIFIFTGVAGRAQSQQKEDLLFAEIPVVFTASRKEQPITESPATITVITATDILYSGATTIPDVLRMVSGMDVMSISSRDQQVSIRGFNSNQSNKLLVLIDGQSVYKDLYGSIFWDLFPVCLDDIERIEVVKSPVSSLYGANAYCGMVNIITKSPEQTPGSHLKLTGGNYNMFIGSLYHGWSGKKLSYKVSGEWDRTDEWQGNEKAGEIFKLNALLRYKTKNNGTLTLSGGRVKTTDRKIFVDYQLGTLQFAGFLDYLQLEYKVGNISLRTFYNRMDVSVDINRELISHVGRTYTFDLEMLHAFKIKERHSFVWGLNYRNNKIEKSFFFNTDYGQDLWALFFEDEVKLSDKLRFSLGGRYDRHPLVKDHFSPRGNILFAPAKDHIFRFSATKAYRNPAFINSYLSLQMGFDFALSEPLPPIRVPFVYSNQGNQLLKPEGIVAYELGYLWLGEKGFQVNVNLFYNKYSDLFITTDRFVFYGQDDIFPGSPADRIPKIINRGFRNDGSAWGIGGEIGLDMKFNKRVSGFVNYAFLQITDDTDNPTTPLINEKDRVRPEYPEHKVNAGLRLIFKNGFSMNFLAHWVAATKHYISYNLKEHLVNMDDYLLINTRLGYILSANKLELSLTVFNLFNDMHYQYPAGIVADFPFSYPLGRRINLTLSYKF